MILQPTIEEIEAFRDMIIRAIKELDYHPVMNLLCSVQKDKNELKKILNELQIMLA